MDAAPEGGVHPCPLSDGCAEEDRAFIASAPASRSARPWLRDERDEGRAGRRHEVRDLGCETGDCQRDDRRDAQDHEGVLDRTLTVLALQILARERQTAGEPQSDLLVELLHVPYLPGKFLQAGLHDAACVDRYERHSASFAASDPPAKVRIELAVCQGDVHERSYKKRTAESASSPQPIPASSSPQTTSEPSARASA